MGLKNKLSQKGSAKKNLDGGPISWRKNSQYSMLNFQFSMRNLVKTS